MCWFCGTCRQPNDTPFDPNCKLIVNYERNPKQYKVERIKRGITHDSLDNVVRAIRDRVTSYRSRSNRR